MSHTPTLKHPVAIIGVGAIMPDANDAAAYWQNIVSGRYSIREVPARRWSIDDYYDPDPRAPDKTHVKIGAFVDGFAFDELRYRIPPRVAASMDDVQKWAIEAARQALSNAGYDRKPFDRERTAVIVGNAMGSELHHLTNMRVSLPRVIRALQKTPAYLGLEPAAARALADQLLATLRDQLPPLTEDSMPGELSNIIAGRVAAIFDLRGANFTTDAACASSMAALQSALDGLEAGRFDMALLGGSDSSMSPMTYVKFCKIGALSPDLSCPFDARANGFVMGEGAGMLLLKRLSDAERDGDRVYAVIRGMGSASDGKGKGITAPNPIGQRLAMQRAYRQAGISPADVTLLEAHGTSTTVGDMVEAEVANELFASAGARPGAVAVGSVKSQIGHLKSAAGIASLLKTALALHHRVLPGSLNFERPNPKIPFGTAPLAVNTRTRPWEIEPGRMRVAGVSSFGFGGTNFHVVLSEHQPEPQRLPPAGGSKKGSNETMTNTEQPVSRPKVFLATAPDAAALIAEVEQRLAQPAESDDAAAAAKGPERAAFSYRTPAERESRGRMLLSTLRNPQPGALRALQGQGIFRASGTGRVAFLFPGQGSQSIGMLRELREKFAVVAETFAEADRVMSGELPRPLSSYIFTEDTPENQAALRETKVCQPAMLAADIALCRLLEQFAIRPDMVAGHSLGEYAALVAGGMLGFAEALLAVSARAREMSGVQVVDPGRMAAVMGPAEALLPRLKEFAGVVPANFNSPNQTVIAGATEPMNRALAALEQAGIRAVPLNVSHAFHSHIVAPAVEPLHRVLSRLPFSPPRIPIVANLDAEPYEMDPAAMPRNLERLARQVAAPVQFVRSVQKLYAMGARLFVEVGPRRVLANFVQDILPGEDALAVSCNHPKLGDLPSLGMALAAAAAAGTGASDEPHHRARENAGAAATAVAPQAAATPAPAPAAAPVPVDFEAIRQKVLAIASQKTGYPVEMLDPELDLEADLGIDTVKQAEMFAEIRAAFGIPRPEGLKLSDYNTLAKVMDFARQRVVSAAAPAAPAPAAQPASAPAPQPEPAPAAATTAVPIPPSPAIRAMAATSTTAPAADRAQNAAPAASPAPTVVVSGASLGLPGERFELFGEDVVERLLRGDPGIDPVPEESRRRLAAQRITRLLKDAPGGPSFEVLDQPDRVARLTGRRGKFDLAAEFGLEPERVAAFDITTRLAIGAGLLALRDARIPLVMRHHTASNGRKLPLGYRLPDALRDDTGVIFASAFPGYDELVQEMERRRQAAEIEARIQELDAIEREVGALHWVRARRAELARQASEPWSLDRRFIFRVLSFAHAQFAELVGARGPNLHINAACASTTSAVVLAHDWIRAGRCRRVVVIGADDITNENLAPWLVGGLLATGAVTTEAELDKAALPFDRRRNGMIPGMGAAGLVVESADAAAERGIRPLTRILGAILANSAYHGSRLDPGHVSEIMGRLLAAVEQEHRLDRRRLAEELVFVSHETYTPARGGSASAEARALRENFAEAASRIVIANTKGFTGHPMAVGIEDAAAVKMLERQAVPPIANHRERDPELGELNLSHGGSYPVRYALRLSAGFGSQVAMTIQEREPGLPERIADEAAHHAWLARVSGLARGRLEVANKTLRYVESADEVSQTSAQISQSSPAPISPAPEAASAPAAAIPAPAAPAPSARPESVPAPAPAAPEMSAPPAATAPAPAPAANTTPVDFETIRQKVLAIASQKTGYPVEMLDPELDLEADLGIDTVKQAEMFAEIRAAFGIPRPEGLKLSDYNTLAKVMDFARQRVVSAAAPGTPTAPAPSARPEGVPAPAPAAASAAQEPPAPELLRADPVRYLSGNAEQTRMCVPVLALRPAARDCRPTGFSPAGRFLLVGEPRHTMELARSIRARGGQAEELDLPPDREAAGETLARTIESSRPDGIFWLASCADPVLPGGNSPFAWQRALDLRARLLFRAAKSFDGMRQGRKTCLIATTRMGGRLGLDGANPDPAAGATAGLVKSLAREWPETLCKAVDFGASASAAEMADALLEELERDPAVVEVGRLGEERVCPTLAELGPNDPAQAQPGLPQQPVVLLTGGAGDIVGAVAIDLARNFRGAFYLCDRVPAAEPGDADVGLLRSNREALKRELARRLSQDGARVTPMQVERALRQIERQSVALATMEAIRQAGAEAHYISADVTDEAALAEAVAGIRQRHGRLDLVVHAAGLEHSQLVARKSAEDFDRIFGVKADGLNALLSACGADSPALVMFGSVAGRFGNLGQTDYAAANDLLARCAWALPRLRGLRALTLAFSGWEGVGMATRGSIPEQLKAAGVDLIPLSEGQASVRRALALGGSGEVIVARSLGRMLDGLRQPGVELAPIRNRLQNSPQRFPLLGQVRDWTVADGLMVEVTFDPRREPYLDHHRIEGTAVLPGVMAVEAFAEAVSLLCPEQQVVTVEDLCFMAPLKLYRDEPRSAMLRLLPLSGPQGREWLAVMETWRELAGGRPQHTLHFHARLKLDRQKPVARDRSPGNGSHRAVERQNIYRAFFHGPSFQVLEKVCIGDGGQVTGWMAPGTERPALSRPGELSSLPMFTELAFQAAGVVEMQNTARMGLPSRVGRLRLHHLPEAPRRVAARVVPQNGGGLYQVQVLTEEGEVLLEMDGYRTSALPQELPPDLRRALQPTEGRS